MLKPVKLSPKSALSSKIVHALEDYNILSIEKGISLVYVNIALRAGFEKFDLPNELEDYLYSFVVYKDSIKLYLNKKILTW